MTCNTTALTDLNLELLSGVAVMIELKIIKRRGLLCLQLNNKSDKNLRKLLFCVIRTYFLMWKQH